MPKILMPQNIFVKSAGVSGVGGGGGILKSKSDEGGVVLMVNGKGSGNDSINKTTANDRLASQSISLPSDIESSEDLDDDDFNSTSSIIEFLTNEQECNMETEDADAIFKEVSRLSDSNDTRSVEEILEEAQHLMNQQKCLFMINANTNNKFNASLYANCNNNKNYNNGNQSKSISTSENMKINMKFTKSFDNIQMDDTSVAESKTQIKGFSSTPETPNRKMSLVNGNVGFDEDFSQCEDSVGNLRTESVLSQESVPCDMQTGQITNYENDEDDDATTVHINGYDTDDGTDTMEEITENMETLQVDVHESTSPNALTQSKARSSNNNNSLIKTTTSTTKMTSSQLVKSLSASSSSSSSSTSSSSSSRTSLPPRQSFSCKDRNQQSKSLQSVAHAVQYRRSALKEKQHTAPSPNKRPSSCHISSSHHRFEYQERRNSVNVVRSSMTATPDSGIHHSQSQYSLSQAQYSPQKSLTLDSTSSSVMKAAESKSFAHKSCNSSPKHLVSTMTSPIETSSSFISREHTLKLEIEQLQEKLKDTEERLESIRIQNESLSHMQRQLRENNVKLQEESEVLKLDVQHLTECANVLRSELQAARADRNDALELQKVLQNDLEESRQERKRALEQKDNDAKMIMDLQRQCREMERILIRKHPDSVSALIVASRGTKSVEQDNQQSRKLLESRIAQLESDAKAQDNKAQEILANVQARFNAVQSKYETHIADLETQVLSLQEINAKLNEKIEFQARSLEYLVKKRQEKYFNNCTQTDDTMNAAKGDANRNQTPNKQNVFTQTKTHHTRDHSTNTIGLPASTFLQSSPGSSASSTANSTPNNSRPNSKQSGLRRPASGSFSYLQPSKLPISQSDTTIALSASASVASLAAKEDAHLIATIRSMRVDLAIKGKAMQRLTRELEDCKKTMRKLQKERDLYKSERQQMVSCTQGNMSAMSSRRGSAHDVNADHLPANTENQALKEALNKYKLLEADYKALHDKRLQDLKTLQTAHERELASCHETVRILQQRLNEREEQSAVRKARKVPVDYYALKAKVSSLERRHTEREERLHLLVEALSKGRINGTLEDLIRDNNNE